MVGYPRPSRQTDKVSARQFERGSGRPRPGSRQPGIAKQILNRPAESRTRNGIVHGPNHFMVGYPLPYPQRVRSRTTLANRPAESRIRDGSCIAPTIAWWATPGPPAERGPSMHSGQSSSRFSGKAYEVPPTVVFGIRTSDEEVPPTGTFRIRTS